MNGGGSVRDVGRDVVYRARVTNERRREVRTSSEIIEIILVKISPCVKLM